MEQWFAEKGKYSLGFAQGVYACVCILSPHGRCSAYIKFKQFLCLVYTLYLQKYYQGIQSLLLVLTLVN